MYEKLFSPYNLGKINLKNRIVMSPMTRNRSINNIPGEIVATYYTQRASAGLIITEGTSPSPNGLGYPRIPGLFIKEQRDAWEKITINVHNSGGKIFLQLMHTGRVSHPDNMSKTAIILAPSPIAMSGKMYTDTGGMQNYPIPSEMTDEQIEKTIDEYVHASEMAINAGFDGVEIHSANGYLIDQFLNTASNKRNDSWGGSIENRTRFGIQVVKKIANKIGSDRVGIRVSPYGAFNDMGIDPKIEDTFEFYGQELNKLDILYMHIVDHSSMGAPEVKPSIKQKLRKNFKNTLILSGGYDAKRAEVDLLEDKCDLVAFGRPFISNPNFVQKIKQGVPLIQPDVSTFYTPGEKGYIDYN